MARVAARTWIDTPAARLGAFGVILLAAFGGGAAIGAAFGPDQGETPTPSEHPSPTTTDPIHSHPSDEGPGAQDG